MAGLIGALAAGALGGAGKGMSENAQGDIKNIYDQMNAEMKAQMEQRIYERGRRDKVGDDEKQRAHERGLVNLRAKGDPIENELRAEQTEDLRLNRKEKAEIKKMRESLAQAENLAQNDPSLQPLVEARRKKLNTMLGAKPTESYSVRTEENPDTGEVKNITELKGAGAPPGAAKPQDKFIVGKQYKDANGNVATYRGNGQWE